MRQHRPVGLAIIWALYLAAFCVLWLYSIDLILLLAPLAVLPGLLAFYLAWRNKPFRGRYILTGLVGVLPMILLTLYVIALGSAWRN